MAVLGLRFCARAFSSCGKWGPLFIAVRGPLTIVASLVAEHRLQTRRLSNCGSRAQLLCSMWDFPRPGLEPVSPALAGRFLTTAPPGKPSIDFLFSILLISTLILIIFLQLTLNWIFSSRCSRVKTYVIDFRSFFFSNICIQCYKFSCKHCFCNIPEIFFFNLQSFFK